MRAPESRAKEGDDESARQRRRNGTAPASVDLHLADDKVLAPPAMAPLPPLCQSGV